MQYKVWDNGIIRDATPEEIEQMKNVPPPDGYNAENEQTETGYRYAEAIDIYPTPFHYAETDESIEKEGEMTDGDE